MLDIERGERAEKKEKKTWWKNETWKVQVCDKRSQINPVSCVELSAKSLKYWETKRGKQKIVSGCFWEWFDFH